MFESQVGAEKEAGERVGRRGMEECVDGSGVRSVDPVRLILSHLGYLTFSPVDSVDPSLNDLSLLDWNHPELYSSLKGIDSIPTKTSDTVYVYYIRRGRYDPQEILNSVSSKHYVTPEFIHFLTSLGDVVDVKEHPGWTGNVHSRTGHDFGGVGSDHGGSGFDGLEKALHWSDISHEMMFVVPSVRTVRDDDLSSTENERKNRGNVERISTDGYSVSSGEGTSISSRTYSDSSRNSIHKSRQVMTTNAGCDLLIIWLESIDDMNEVPISELPRPHFHPHSNHASFPPPL